jgi:hypothetical protein
MGFRYRLGGRWLPERALALEAGHGGPSPYQYPGESFGRRDIDAGSGIRPVPTLMTRGARAGMAGAHRCPGDLEHQREAAHGCSPRRRLAWSGAVGRVRGGSEPYTLPFAYSLLGGAGQSR